MLSQLADPTDSGVVTFNNFMDAMNEESIKPQYMTHSNPYNDLKWHKIQITKDKIVDAITSKNSLSVRCVCYLAKMLYFYISNL